MNALCQSQVASLRLLEKQLVICKWNQISLVSFSLLNTEVTERCEVHALKSPTWVHVLELVHHNVEVKAQRKYLSPFQQQRNMLMWPVFQLWFSLHLHNHHDTKYGTDLISRIIKSNNLLHIVPEWCAALVHVWCKLHFEVNHLVNGL